MTVDVVAAAREAFSRQRALHLSTAAAAAGFWLFMSVIPASIAIVNILGLVLPQQTVANALGRLAVIFPGNFGQVLAERLANVAAPSPGTGMADALIVVVCLWTISSAAHTLLDALAQVFDVPKVSIVKRRLLALAIAAVAIVCIGAAALAVISVDDISGPLPSAALEVALMAVMVLLLFIVGSRRRVDLRWGAALAVVAAVVLYLMGVLLRAYVEATPSMSQVYGTVAGVVAGMLAAYIGAFAVLLTALAARVLALRATDTLRP